MNLKHSSFPRSTTPIRTDKIGCQRLKINQKLNKIHFITFKNNAIGFNSNVKHVTKHFCEWNVTQFPMSIKKSQCYILIGLLNSGRPLIDLPLIKQYRWNAHKLPVPIPKWKFTVIIMYRTISCFYRKKPHTSNRLSALTFSELNDSKPNESAHTHTHMREKIGGFLL